MGKQSLQRKTGANKGTLFEKVRRGWGKGARTFEQRIISVKREKGG